MFAHSGFFFCTNATTDLLINGFLCGRLDGMEVLNVRNFAGIKKAEVNINKFTIFIGPQASGKSVCAKLTYYFRLFARRLFYGVISEQNKNQIKSADKELFIKYFPCAAWGDEEFRISYIFGDIEITVQRKGKTGSTFDITYSDGYNSLLRAARSKLKKIKSRTINQSATELPLEYRIDNELRRFIEKDMQERGPFTWPTYFVPAGRSFFSMIRSNVFSFIASNINIDPFLVEFGQIYENFRNFGSRGSRVRNKRIDSLIKGEYQRIKGEDFIKTNDGRVIPIEHSSSGQQELLPLIIMLERLENNIGKRTRRISANLFIEEPEAHLFPDAQKDLIDLIFDKVDPTIGMCLITTHSPYILSSINNIIYAGVIEDKASEFKIQYTHSSPKIQVNRVNAYLFKNGEVSNIMDEETGLIDANAIDAISSVISDEFGKLMDIDFRIDEIKESK